MCKEKEKRDKAQKKIITGIFYMARNNEREGRNNITHVNRERKNI